MKPNRHGYGRIIVDGKLKQSHRLAYELSSGAEIPDGLLVCHRCDNRICCNPDHLFLGTVADNNADARAKGRAGAFFRSGAAGYSERARKLTVEQVMAIRTLGEPVKDAMIKYGVSRSYIFELRADSRCSVSHSRQVVSNPHGDATRSPPR